jgi:hypothetical protein
MKARRNANPWLAVATWGLVLTVVGIVPAAGNERTVPDANWAEPNDAKLFSATWTSATLSFVLYNPDVNPTMAANGPTRTLVLSGRVDVESNAKLFGLFYVEADLKAVTETGRLLTGSDQSPYGRHYTSFSNPNSYQYVSLDFAMDPNLGYPLVLKEVSWVTYALMYQQEQWMDIPFQVTGQWIQIAPGIKVQLTQATAHDGVYRYELKGQYEGPVNPFIPIPAISSFESLPWQVVDNAQLLNDKGVATKLSASGESIHWSASGSGGNATCSGYGECSTCGDVKTMRFRIISGLYEIKLPFVLTDVPVPTL